MTFGLSPQGFNAMRLADIKQALENAFIAQFGDINLDPQSVFGQEIGVLSKTLADIWDNLEDVYLSQYPNSASGIALDNVVQLNGITRLPQTQTTVTATVSGIEGTEIPFNSLASISSNNELFFLSDPVIITQGNADIVQVTVGTLTTQPYIVVLNNVSYIYSLPVITFSNSGAIFVTGNIITVTINGVELAGIDFITNSNITLSAVASAIQGFASGTVCTCVVTNPNIITITPLTGQQVIINNIIVTDGSTQATYAITYLTPGSNNDLTAGMVAILNSGTPAWLAVDNMNGTFTINANVPSIPFSAQLGTNLSVSYVASPANFVTQQYGPIACPIGALSQIVTAIQGWNSVTNLVAGNTGTFQETDAALRIRRKNSISILGNATVSAIEAGLLQKVAGVTSAVVYENTTLTQFPFVITFPGQFQASDIISVYYNATSFTVNYNTNQATTMAALVAAFEGLPQVSSASYGGTGNQVLTVNVTEGTELFINSLTTSVSMLTAAITGGIPPKSFEAVVEGGTDLAVATQIWLSKPAGIETYGNINDNMGISIVDSQGNTQVIFFSRPVPIYIWVTVALTLYSSETFPPNGLALVAQNILAYGNSLGVGQSVLFQRVLAQIFTVPGIASGDMEIAATVNEISSPSYATSDITIAQSQISVWSINNIVVTIS